MRKYSGIFLSFVLLFVVGHITHVSAAGFSIKPLRQNIQLKPGQTVAKTLIVTNTTKTPETIAVNATSFNTVDKHYNYAFGKPPDQSDWIQFIEDQAVLAPGERHTFHYNVAVPMEAEPGGNYIAIFASISNKTQADGKATTIVERAGSLIYLTVTGKETKIGSVLSYITPKLTFSKTNSWDIQIQNKGNTHFDSQITTTLYNGLLGGKLASNESHLIMPGTIRELNGTYHLSQWPSIYRLNAQVGLGDNPPVSRNLWLVSLPPLTSAVIFAIVAAILILMTRKLLRQRRHRKYRSS